MAHLRHVPALLTWFMHACTFGGPLTAADDGSTSSTSSEASDTSSPIDTTATAWPSSAEPSTSSAEDLDGSSSTSSAEDLDGSSSTSSAEDDGTAAGVTIASSSTSSAEDLDGSSSTSSTSCETCCQPTSSPPTCSDAAALTCLCELVIDGSSWASCCEFWSAGCIAAATMHCDLDCGACS